MLIEELAQEYRTQYNVLCAKMDGLRPLLSVYGGEDLYRLRRKLRTYYEWPANAATLLPYWKATTMRRTAYDRYD